MTVDSALPLGLITTGRDFSGFVQISLCLNISLKEEK